LLLIFHVDLDLFLCLRVPDGKAIADLDFGAIFAADA